MISGRKLLLLFESVEFFFQLVEIVRQSSLVVLKILNHELTVRDALDLSFPFFK